MCFCFKSGRSPCLVNPCHNNGTCVSMGTYECHCLEGFEGQNCETSKANKFMLHSSFIPLLPWFFSCYLLWISSFSNCGVASFPELLFKCLFFLCCFHMLCQVWPDWSHLVLANLPCVFLTLRFPPCQCVVCVRACEYEPFPEFLPSIVFLVVLVAFGL